MLAAYLPARVALRPRAAGGVCGGHAAPAGCGGSRGRGVVESGVIAADAV